MTTFSYGWLSMITTGVPIVAMVVKNQRDRCVTIDRRHEGGTSMTSAKTKSP